MRAALRPLTLVVLAAFAACRSNDIGTQAIRFGPETLPAIEPGVSRPHVIGLLGEPREKLPLARDVERWSWGYREQRSPDGGVVYLIDNDPTAAGARMCFVEFKSGRVVRAWRE